MGRLNYGRSLALAVGVGLVASTATPALAGTSGSISPERNAPRFLPGSDAGAPAHFNDFSPATINYSDCVSQIDIEFTLDLSTVPGDEIQMWAGAGSADCTQTSARTPTASGSPETFPGRCWPVGAPFVPSGTQAVKRLHALDLISNIGQPDPPTAYSTVHASVLANGTALCQPYATTGAVTLSIYFIFVAPGTGSGSTAPVPPDGVSGVYSTAAALVGPYAPVDVAVPTDELTATTLTVNWSPQAEGTIQGYNIYVIDQGPDGGGAGTFVPDAGSTYFPPSLLCPQSSCSAETDAGHDAADAGAAPDAAKDAAPDATEDATVHDTGATSTSCDAGLGPVDAGAYTDATAATLLNMGCQYKPPQNLQNGVTGTASCHSKDLVNVFTIDAGLGGPASTEEAGTTTTTLIVDAGDAGDEFGDVDAGDSGGMQIASSANPTTQEVAGISNVALTPDYVAGPAIGSYTLTGLKTGDQYAIAVAAVDSYGNVGPLGVAPSPTNGASGYAACSTPTAVNDFFNEYETDGGRAGGGYCSVNAVGAPETWGASLFGLSVTAAAVARVRRSRRRSR
jgi:hypothetical protein